MQSNLSPLHQLPEWLPDGVRLYLDHTEDGMSLRALARRDGRHASTVMRLVRRYENRRDDPLMDEALTALSRGAVGAALDPVRKDSPMSAPICPQSLTVDEATILQEGRRILRRLAEAGAVLAIAPDMEKAVVMRDMPDGRTARTASRRSRLVIMTSLPIHGVDCSNNISRNVARIGCTTAIADPLKFQCRIGTAANSLLKMSGRTCGR